MIYEDGKGRTCSIPTAWTSLAAADPFVVLSAGRSLFRIEDLLTLASLVRKLSIPEAECKGDSVDDVKTNISLPGSLERT